VDVLSRKVYAGEVQQNLPVFVERFFLDFASVILEW
jgi:hypothetical protein